MWQTIKELMNKSQPEEADTSVELATAALLCEVAHADREVTEAEHQALKLMLQKILGLTGMQAEDLYFEAMQAMNQSVSLYDFTGQLRQLTQDERFNLVAAMWEVANADGSIDPYEESIIRQVADLIHLPHSEFIRAKKLAQ
ncbi:tellurite resistance TerB family protein [Salinibius halmophilus]|uniref:tellurite resistance TerB family protein n=1 Tax=Salinibius halmophilus TaxID=1853216 RepID=UPI000E65FC27|nr:TerB family tellurite resistance protein [Salinibius halmophilus]